MTDQQEARADPETVETEYGEQYVIDIEEAPAWQ